MSALDELATAALIGTGRAEVPILSDLSPHMKDFYSALEEHPPEDRVLIMAGTIALYQSAGRVPSRAAPTDWRLPAFRPEGDRPVCSPAAARLFERLLIQTDASLLPELLERMDSAGQRVPDILLPQILEHGAKVSRLRPLLLPLIGERGRWLSALNPAWGYAAVDLRDSRSLRLAWEADPPGRVALAQFIRRHDPPLALRLIRSSWANEPDTVRRDLVAALERGLSMADEPFLERALDDRFAHARQKAALLLTNLPGSRLVQRMTAGAGSVMSLVDGRLVPSFPSRISDQMVRDGITRWSDELMSKTNRPAARTTAEWSRFLIQTIGAIPLGHWEETLGSADTIVEAALNGKWPRTFITALSTAAFRQNNARWIDIILEADNYSERSGRLVGALDPDECFTRLATRMAGGHDEAIIVFLRHWPNDWDESSGALIVDFLGWQSEQEPESRSAPALRYLSRSFAHHCPPSLASSAADSLSGRLTSNAWRACFTHLVRTLQVRQEISHAIESSAATSPH